MPSSPYILCQLQPNLVVYGHLSVLLSGREWSWPFIPTFQSVNGTSMTFARQCRIRIAIPGWTMDAIGQVSKRPFYGLSLVSCMLMLIEDTCSGPAHYNIYYTVASSCFLMAKGQRTGRRNNVFSNVLPNLVQLFTILFIWIMQYFFGFGCQDFFLFTITYSQVTLAWFIFWNFFWFIFSYMYKLPMNILSILINKDRFCKIKLYWQLKREKIKDRGSNLTKTNKIDPIWILSPRNFNFPSKVSIYLFIRSLLF